MKNWNFLVDSYIRYCEMRGLEQSTLKTRERELNKFGLWLKGKGFRSKKIGDVNEQHILLYIKNVCQYKAKATTFGKISHLNGFGEWLCLEGYWKKNPIKWIERPKINSHRQVPKVHNRKQLIGIYQETFKHQHPYFSKLYPAAFIIFYSTGLRRQELINLDITDWNQEERSLLIRGTKTKIDRLVPLQKDAAHIIQDYMNARSRLLIKKGITSEDAFFIGRSGQRITPLQVSKGLQDAAYRSGVEKFTLHSLRHNCTTDLLESGVHITKVQKILGHSCIESTFRYTHITDENRKLSMEKHPINQILGVCYE